MAHLFPLQSICGAGTDRSTFLDNQISCVNQQISASLQPPTDSSISTKAIHSTGSMTNEVRSTYYAVSSAASIYNTTSGESFDLLNNYEGMAFLLHSLQQNKIQRKIHSMECINLIYILKFY